jgi:hypothetical protein
VIENDAPLIPTRRKKRPPRGWSYAIGSEILSRALASAPQYDELSVSFYCGKTTEPKGVALERLRSQRCLVLVASYSRIERGRAAGREEWRRGWYDPKWDITVYACPSMHRAAAREQVLAEGLARVVAWLARPIVETEAFQAHDLRLVFDPVAGSLEYLEDLPWRK